MKSLAWALVLPIMSEAANYSAKKAVADGIEIVQLGDRAQATEVSIVPSIGNIAYAMTVHGKNILWLPFKSLAEMKAKPALCGVPFLAPWANRLDQDAFYANGKKYLLNPELGNLRRDPNQKPIHGLLLFSPHWKVTRLEADDHIGARHQPSGILALPRSDGAISVRACGRDDVPAGGRRARSRNAAGKSGERADAGGRRLPSVLSDCPTRRAISGRFTWRRASTWSSRPIADSHGRAHAGGVARSRPARDNAAGRCLHQSGARQRRPRRILGGGRRPQNLR